MAGSGRTVLFVSHNMSAIQSLCERAVLLQNGRVGRHGPAHEIVREYLRNEGSGKQFVRPPHADGRPTLTRAALTEPEPGGSVVRVEIDVTVGADRRVSLDVRLDRRGRCPGRVRIPRGSSRGRPGSPPGRGESAHGRAPDRPTRTGWLRRGPRPDRPGSRSSSTGRTTVSGLRWPARRGRGRDRVHPQHWGYGSYELPVERLPNPNRLRPYVPTPSLRRPFAGHGRLGPVQPRSPPGRRAMGRAGLSAAGLPPARDRLGTRRGGERRIDRGGTEGRRVHRPDRLVRATGGGVRPPPSRVRRGHQLGVPAGRPSGTPTGSSRWRCPARR